MTGELRVAAVQHDIVWSDRDANFEHLAPMVRAAAAWATLSRLRCQASS